MGLYDKNRRSVVVVYSSSMCKLFAVYIFSVLIPYVALFNQKSLCLFKVQVQGCDSFLPNMSPVISNSGISNLFFYSSVVSEEAAIALAKSAAHAASIS